MAKGKFVFGAVMGALLGLAFAPKKGSELRKELQSEIGKKDGNPEKVLKKNAALVKADIEETAKEVYHNPEVQKQLARGKKEAGKLVEKAQKKIQESSEEWVQMARENLGVHATKSASGKSKAGKKKK